MYNEDYDYEDLEPITEPSWSIWDELRQWYDEDVRDSEYLVDMMG